MVARHRLFRWCHGESGQNASIDRDQMWRELDHCFASRCQADFLFDFGQMSVLGHTVRTDAFVAFDIEVGDVRLSTGPAHSAQ